MSSDNNSQDIAIIGMAGRFPGADDITSFWNNLAAGKETLTFLSDAELIDAGVDAALLENPLYINSCGNLEGIELFDAGFFDMSRTEAEITDPQHRLLLETAYTALEDAGYLTEEGGIRIGVYASVGISHYLLNNIFSQSDLVNKVGLFQVLLGNDKSYACTRISHKLNLTGPCVNIDTACSSSLVAIAMAVKSLLSYECDIVLAGGAKINVPQKVGYLWSEGTILSSDGHCRAFDAKADGTIFSSGVGMLVLKRLSEAKSAGDHIYAVIKGVALNNDGSQKISYAAPSITGQTAVIAEAIAVADVAPETITYIESHGTGTALGDAIEISALADVFQTSTNKVGFCGVGSLKTNIGYLEVAAGVAGMIKTALSLKHKQIPPSLHFNQANPEINFDNSPFYVNTTLRTWNTNGIPRRAGVSSFGIGGTNAHIILEEAPSEEQVTVKLPQLLLLSAKTRTALTKIKLDLAIFLQKNPSTNLADISYTLKCGRASYSHRCMLVCNDINDAISGLPLEDSLSLKTSEYAGEQIQVVFLFSGRELQLVHQELELYRAQPAFNQSFIECCNIIADKLHIDLYDFLHSDKTKTTYHQNIEKIGLFAMEYSLACFWQSLGIVPDCMIGQGLSEYVAGCLANVFTLADAFDLLIIDSGLSEALDLNLREEVVTRVAKINFTPPKIPFISRKTGLLIAPQEAANPLYWSSVLHEPMDLTKVLNTLLPDKKTILLQMCINQASTCLIKQVTSDYECLILPSTQGYGHQTLDTNSLLTTIGQLWLSGLKVNWSNYYVSETRRRISLPTYPFERKKYWIEPAKTRHYISLQDNFITHELHNSVTTVPENSKHNRNFVAPRNELEQCMANIWQTFLNQDKIGIHDNFFELGGNSVMAMKVIAASKNLGIEIKPMQLFRYPSIAQLTAEQDTNFNTNHKTNKDLMPEILFVPDIDENLSVSRLSKAIFFTGATGFVGAFLLSQLLEVYKDADIYCLIRAKNTEDAQARLRQNLMQYGLWQNNFQTRIISVLGDLEKPLLGVSNLQFEELAQLIDVIIHCGAIVNFVSSFEQLKPANIQGTHEIIKLANKVKLKVIHYISTISVFPDPIYIPNKQADESDALDFDATYKGGYAQTKWVAEKIMLSAQSKGFPINIYRLGRITGSSNTGVWNTNDFLCKIIKGCIQLGLAPRTNYQLDFTPVDYVSNAIISIMQQPDALGKTFHLVHPDFTTVSDVINHVNQIGYHIREVPYSVWYNALLDSVKSNDDNALHVVIDLFEPSEDEDPWEKYILKISCSNTIAALNQSGIHCPDAKMLLPVYFEYLINSNYLPKINLV